MMKQPFRINIDLTACLIGSTVYSVHDDDANSSHTPVRSVGLSHETLALLCFDQFTIFTCYEGFGTCEVRIGFAESTLFCLICCRCCVSYINNTFSPYLYLVEFWFFCLLFAHCVCSINCTLPPYYIPSTNCYSPFPPIAILYPLRCYSPPGPVNCTPPSYYIPD